MPSSYPRAHSRAFGYSPRPPVSVYGTGTLKARYEVFLGGMDSVSYLSSEDLRPSPFSVLAALRICLQDPPTTFDQHNHPPADLSFRVTPSLKRFPGGTGILTCFPFDYASRPRLRSRLTLGGRTFPRNPWAFGVADSHRHYRYLCRQSLFLRIHQSSRSSFISVRTLPYHPLPKAGDSQLRCLA